MTITSFPQCVERESSYFNKFLDTRSLLPACWDKLRGYDDFWRCAELFQQPVKTAEKGRLERKTVLSTAEYRINEDTIF